jgi:hypothetical protein
MSDAIIKLFQEQALAGAFRVTRKGAMKEGFEAVAKGMERQFRDKQWTVDKVSDKYDNEKKKYRLFINFLDISGTSYDDETGLLDGSSENWDRFNRLFPKSGWLRKPFPLGRHVNVYAEIFAKERATGKEAESTHELERRDEASDDDPFMSGKEDGEVERSSQGQA